VGKTSEREGVLLISSISGNYISAKIKPTEFYLSLPRFPCLKLTGRNQKSATSNSVHRQSYRTDCHSIKCCTDFLKNVPRIYCSCTAAVRPVRTDKCALSPRFACSCTYCSGKINVVVPNPYRTDLSSLLAASKSVP
jgi:hypothetical protein